MNDETHPAAFPTGFSFTPRPRRKVPHRTYRKCRTKPPCGNACVLNSNCKHEYHCCQAPGCICHSRESIERVRKKG